MLTGLRDLLRYTRATAIVGDMMKIRANDIGLGDMAYLQQDAYDPVDVSVPLERQREMFNLVRGLIQRDYPFNGKDEARSFFTQLTGLLKNLNYAPRDSEDYTAYQAQIDELVQTLGRTPATTPV